MEEHHIREPAPMAGKGKVRVVRTLTKDFEVSTRHNEQDHVVRHHTYKVRFKGSEKAFALWKSQNAMDSEDEVQRHMGS